MELCLRLSFLLLLGNNFRTCHVTWALDLSNCRTALGMQSEEIPDAAISASSSTDPIRFGPSCARIRHETMGGAWCPKFQVSNEPAEYLQIDFDKLKVITLVETQGRFDQGQGHEFTEQYMLNYQREESGSWIQYQNRQREKILRGNVNTYMVELNELSPPIIARRLRILPISQQVKNVCLRVEIYGCEWTEGVTSYEMKQGDRRGSDMELVDRTYDGTVLPKNNPLTAPGRGGSGSHFPYLTGGLGQLMDGVLGDSHFRRHHGSKGFEWVGWKKKGGESEGDTTDFTEITFKFDKTRVFNRVSFYCNKAVLREVAVFKSAKAFFSLDGKNYHLPPVEFSNQDFEVTSSDGETDQAHWVIVDLQGHVARFVKMWLFFGSKWLMISEVTFDSEPLPDASTSSTAPQKVTRQQRYQGNASSEDALVRDVATKMSNEAQANDVLYDAIGKESGSRKNDHKSESNRQKERKVMTGHGVNHNNNNNNNNNNDDDDVDDNNNHMESLPGKTKLGHYSWERSNANSTEPLRSDKNNLNVLTAMLPVVTKKMTSDDLEPDVDQSESSTRLKAIIAGLLCATALCAAIVVGIFIFAKRRKMNNRDFLTPYQSSPLSNKSEAVPSAPPTPPPPLLSQERPTTPIYSNDCNSSLSYVGSVARHNATEAGISPSMRSCDEQQSNTYEDINNFKTFTPIERGTLDSTTGCGGNNGTIMSGRLCDSRLPFEIYSCHNTFQNHVPSENFNSSTMGRSHGRRTSKGSQKQPDRAVLKAPVIMNDDYFINHVTGRNIPTVNRFGHLTDGAFNTFADNSYNYNIRSIPGIEAKTMALPFSGNGLR